MFANPDLLTAEAPRWQTLFSFLGKGGGNCWYARRVSSEQSPLSYAATACISGRPVSVRAYKYMVCLDSVSLPNEALLGSLKSRLGLGDGRKEIADVLVGWYD
jgi:hypothetical protein